MAKRPTSVEGGCLCGGVRYRINFAEDHDWEKGPHTCQCTQCRKNSGRLIYQFHTVTAAELTWLSKSTYAEYHSSPGCLRPFCKNCGSPLGWMDTTKEGTDIELAVGSLDEEVLLGGRDANDEPTGGFAEALANPDGDRFHVRNEIKGITDHTAFRGTRYLKGSADGPMK